MLVQLFLVAVPLLAAFVFAKLYYRRFIKYAGLPQVKPSLIWGNMLTLHENMQRVRPDEHGDAAFAMMHDSLGKPPVMLIDIWPAHEPLLLVTSHDIAEQITRVSKAFPWSIAKSPLLWDLQELLGTHSILLKQNEEWKAMRKRLNPGFAPQYLMTFIPRILDMTDRFLGHLDSLASTGEVFALEPLCTNLTFDIIGTVTMDVDFKAQAGLGQRNEVSNQFLELQRLDEERTQMSPFLPKYFIKRRQVAAGKRLDSLVHAMVQAKWDEMQKAEGGGAKKSVLALSLQGHTVLDHQLLVETADSLKTFLFAGHDTTSILLQWAFYEMSRTPRTLKALRAELDAVFGPDCSPELMKKQLLAHGEDVMQKMPYTSAVIKETLRLYPPAGTARLNPKNSPHKCIVHDGQGNEYCLDGLVIYVAHSFIQRDPAVFGPDVNDFVPERWMGQTDTWESSNGGTAAATGGEKAEPAHPIPPSAWRPFERGPRNCIGQELANIEARVILAITARRYDFTKVGLGEFEVDEKGRAIMNEKGIFRVKEELYTTRAVTAKPVDGMRVRVALSEQAKASSPPTKR